MESSNVDNNISFSLKSPIINIKTSFIDLNKTLKFS